MWRASVFVVCLFGLLLFMSVVVCAVGVVLVLRWVVYCCVFIVSVWLLGFRGLLFCGFVCVCVGVGLLCVFVLFVVVFGCVFCVVLLCC